MSAPLATARKKTLEEFDVELKTLNIEGQWRVKEDAFYDGPAPRGVPYLWKWSVVHEKMIEGCEVMPESLTARRNFSFLNPGMNSLGTTHTLLMGMQIVKPGEIAWAHRHSIGALRFAIQGSPRLYTVVNGEQMPMETHDLVLTPSWNWHDHHNEGDQNGIWLDVLDVPLVMGLNQAFFEPYGRNEQSRRERASDYISRRAGVLRPAWEQRCEQNFPYRYPWKAVAASLEEFADSEGSPYEGLSLEYVNPATGGSALPTMACWIQVLRAGFETKPRRRTASAIYYAVEGEGTTVVGDKEMHWSPRDAFVVPNWMWHRHINRSGGDRAILFCVTDEPLLSHLGLYREQPENSLRRAPLPPVPARTSV